MVALECVTGYNFCVAEFSVTPAWPLVFSRATHAIWRMLIRSANPSRGDRRCSFFLDKKMQEKIDAHGKLWSIRLPIPGETFAAPSYRIAVLMQEASDKANHAWLTDKQKKGELCYLSYDECMALVEEIEDPEEHAELMEEFDPEEWGITEAQMNEPDVDPRQLALPLESQELGGVKS